MKYLVFSIFTFIALTAFSQSREASENSTLDEKPNSIEKPTSIVLKIGLGNPVSDFGNDDLNDPNSGLAKSGLLIEGALEHYVSKKTFLTAMGRYNSNRINETEFLTLYRNAVPSNVNVTFNSDPWKVRSFMVGFGTKIMFDDKTNLITRFMTGYSSASTPSFTANLSDGLTTIIEEQSSANGGAISYLLGLGLNMNIANNMKVLLAIDYFTATPEISDVNFRATRNGALVANETFSFSQKIRLINFSLGLAIPL